MKIDVRRTTGFLLLVCVVSGCTREASSSAETQTIPVGNDLELTGKGYDTSWPKLYGPSGNCVANTPVPKASDANQWKAAWSIPAGTGYSAPVGVAGSLLIWDRIDNQVRLRKVRVADGDTLWSKSFSSEFVCDYAHYSSGPYSTPLIMGPLIYCISPEGVLRALTLRDGDLVWKCDLAKTFDVPTLGYPVGHSPLGLDDRVIVNVGGRKPSSCIVAFNAETGEIAWQAGEHLNERIYGSHGSPTSILVGGTDYVSTVTSDSILCVRAEDGQVHGQIKFGTESADTPNAATPVVIGDGILVSGFRANVLCLRIKPEGGFEEVWANRRSIESSYSPLTFVNGIVYGWHAFDRTLRCIDATTGNLHWKKRTVFGRGNHILFANATMGTQMIALGEDGCLGVIEVDQGSCEILSATPSPAIEGPCYSMPAWISGRLFIRNESELRCYELMQ